MHRPKSTWGVGPFRLGAYITAPRRHQPDPRRLVLRRAGAAAPSSVLLPPCTICHPPRASVFKAKKARFWIPRLHGVGDLSLPARPHSPHTLTLIPDPGLFLYREARGSSQWPIPATGRDCALPLQTGGSGLKRRQVLPAGFRVLGRLEGKEVN